MKYISLETKVKRQVFFLVILLSTVSYPLVSVINSADRPPPFPHTFSVFTSVPSASAPIHFFSHCVFPRI